MVATEGARGGEMLLGYETARVRVLSYKSAPMRIRVSWEAIRSREAWWSVMDIVRSGETRLALPVRISTNKYCQPTATSPPQKA